MISNFEKRKIKAYLKVDLSNTSHRPTWHIH